jgi:uroporphyrinogen decarboxylase
MNSLYRERFAATLAHQPVDRCPLDLCGMPQSSIENIETERALAAFLGFSEERPPHYDKADWRILEHFDVDFRRVGTLVSFETGRNRRISETEFVDAYGLHYRFGGLYWDIVEGPLQYADLDAVAAYEFPRADQMDPHLLDICAEQARWLHDETPYVVVGEHPVFGVLELACWLCGYDHIMLMMAADPEFIHVLFKKILAFQQPVIEAYYERLGPYLDVTTSGDDFGTQHGLFMSPEMWRAFVKPYMQARIAFTHRFTNAAYLHHTCGAVFDIIGDLAEIGVDVLNPIQPHAQGMEPERLKAAYGDRIVFHGGLDTQEVLPSNDDAVIDAAVERLLRAMRPRETGGYIFAPAHNIQRDVSPRSIARMYEAAREFSNGFSPAQ